MTNSTLLPFNLTKSGFFGRVSWRMVISVFLVSSFLVFAGCRSRHDGQHSSYRPEPVLLVTNMTTSNVFVTNLFFTNVMTTNVVVTNPLITKVRSTNFFFTNVFLTNVFVANVPTTNVFIANLHDTNGGTADLEAVLLAKHRLEEAQLYFEAKDYDRALALFHDGFVSADGKIAAQALRGIRESLERKKLHWYEQKWFLYLLGTLVLFALGTILALWRYHHRTKWGVTVLVEEHSTLSPMVLSEEFRLNYAEIVAVHSQGAGGLLTVSGRSPRLVSPPGVYLLDPPELPPSGLEEVDKGLKFARFFWSFFSWKLEIRVADLKTTARAYAVLRFAWFTYQKRQWHAESAAVAPDRERDLSWQLAAHICALDHIRAQD